MLQTYWRPSECCATSLLLLDPVLQGWCFWILRYTDLLLLDLLHCYADAFGNIVLTVGKYPNAIDSIPLSNYPQLHSYLISAVCRNFEFNFMNSICLNFSAYYGTWFLSDVSSRNFLVLVWRKAIGEKSVVNYRAPHQNGAQLGYALCSLCSFYELHCSKTPDSAIAHLNRKIKTIFGLLKWDDCRQIPGQGFQKILRKILRISKRLPCATQIASHHRQITWKFKWTNDRR